MSLPVFDKALVLLIVLEVIVATNGIASADPPPSECDSYCRERRYTKGRDGAGIVRCGMVKYRWCLFCNTSSGSCKGNTTEDELHDGTCKEQTVKQSEGFPVPETCDAMCPFPQQSGLFTNEAAEGPNTYTDITTWVESSTVKVWKCYKENEFYKIWENEGIKWNKKLDE